MFAQKSFFVAGKNCYAGAKSLLLAETAIIEPEPLLAQSLCLLLAETASIRLYSMIDGTASSSEWFHWSHFMCS